MCVCVCVCVCMCVCVCVRRAEHSAYQRCVWQGKVQFAFAARNKSKLEDLRQELCQLHPSAKARQTSC